MKRVLPAPGTVRTLNLPNAAPVTADWNETLRALEAALIAGDADRVAEIAVVATLGPVPDALAGRATAVLDRISDLEAELELRLAAISHELDRLPARAKWGAPPAPSQLDCSA